MRWLWAAPVSLLLLVAWAQSPPEAPKSAALVNSGKPMRPALQCTEEDMQVAGLSCAEDAPCKIYLELSALESAGNQIVTAGNLHSEATTLSSIVLSSSDNGKTWIEPFERVRGATLERAQFIDFQHGWVAGEILQPVPQDPFLLITADGGKTWRKQVVFEDGRPGSIHQIWFTSPASGNLVFDRGVSSDGPRYESYESATGGDNWMVRAASDDPIRIKGAPAETTTTNADWRLRPDASTKANLIEKRQGAGWTTVASFAVEVGICKPPAIKEPEPPPDIQTDQPPAEGDGAKGTLSLPALRNDQASPKRPKK